MLEMATGIPCGIPIYNVKIYHSDSKGMIYFTKSDPHDLHGILYLKCHLANIKSMDVNGFYRILRRYKSISLRVIKKGVAPFPIDEAILFTWYDGTEKIINELIVDVDDCATNTEEIISEIEQIGKKDFYKWTEEEKETLIHRPILLTGEGITSQRGFDYDKKIIIIN